jgi:hypothetical protein
MAEVTRGEFEKLVADMVLVKNDVNTIKANTQVTASILSLINGSDLAAYVFSIADSERLCKALMICRKPTTAKELCDALEVKQPNIRRDVLSKLLDSLLTVCDGPGNRVTYKRASYLDAIGFDKMAASKYPNLKGLI